MQKQKEEQGPEEDLEELEKKSLGWKGVKDKRNIKPIRTQRTFETLIGEISFYKEMLLTKRRRLADFKRGLDILMNPPLSLKSNNLDLSHNQVISERIDEIGKEVESLEENFVHLTEVLKDISMIDRVEWPFYNSDDDSDENEAKVGNLNVPLPNNDNFYMFHAVGTPYYKLGHSIYPKNRIRSIQTGCPLQIRGVLFCLGGVAIEKYFHEKYSYKRVIGEWFKLNKEEIQETIKICLELRNASTLTKIIKENTSCDHAEISSQESDD